MTQRFVVNHTYFDRTLGMTTGSFMVSTEMNKAELANEILDQVSSNLGMHKMFFLPGAMRMQDPCKFIDKEGRYIAPVIETEKEFEERFNRGEETSPAM